MQLGKHQLKADVAIEPLVLIGRFEPKSHTAVGRVATCGSQVDTARIYSAGETENILGRILGDFGSKPLVLGTKVHPSQAGALSAVTRAFAEACWGFWMVMDG